MECIEDINHEYIEYPEKNKTKFKTMKIDPNEPAKPFVDDYGIYIPCERDHRYHKLLISKELFVEAYNKWIKE